MPAMTFIFFGEKENVGRSIGLGGKYASRAFPRSQNWQPDSKEAMRL